MVHLDLPTLSALKMYMMLGGIGTVFGIAYFVLSTMEIEFTKPQQMALLIAGVSFGLTVASYGMLLIRRERLFYDIEVQKNLDIASEFLHYWEEFETPASRFSACVASTS